MTTIVGTHTMIASDSRVTMDQLPWMAPKLFRRNGAVIGVAGDAGKCNQFLRWYGSKRAKPNYPGDNNAPFMSAIVLNKKGLFFYGDDWEPTEINDSYYAIGSGAIAAMTAMKVYGATPEEAIKAACAVCNDSDLPVQVMYLHEPT